MTKLFLSFKKKKISIPSTRRAALLIRVHLEYIFYHATKTVVKFKYLPDFTVRGTYFKESQKKIAVSV